MVQLARALSGRWSILARVSVSLAILLVAGVVLHDLGRWLVVADPLEPSRVAVVLVGDASFRAEEAALLFRENWVSQIWLTRGRNPSRSEVDGRPRIQARDDTLSNLRVLEQFGVPPSAINILNVRGWNTASELQIVAAALRRERVDRAIIVTSKRHTRRVRATWRALVGESPKAIVRPARNDPYDPGRWWQRRGQMLAVSHEVLGLLNVWAGFPVRAGERTDPRRP
jgi:uncharacterized SAM-binding protein YcdF (DUF218 family)